MLRTRGGERTTAQADLTFCELCSTDRLTRGHWNSPSLGQLGSGQIVSLEGSSVRSFIILYDEI